MNSEVRDHLLFLKGALDLITDGTTADTGTSTYLRIERGSANASALETVHTSGATSKITADGSISWGVTGIVDTRLRRNSNGQLVLDTGGAAYGASLAVASSAGQRASLSAQVSGDSFARAVLFGDATASSLELGNGSGSRDVSIARANPGDILITSLGTTAATRVKIEGTGGQRSLLDLWVNGDSSNRTRIAGDATMQGLELGPGNAAADTNLYRNAANHLMTDDHLSATVDGVATKVVAGAITDANFTIDENGTLGIDSTNGRLYFRYGGAWHYVTQTA